MEYKRRNDGVIMANGVVLKDGLNSFDVKQDLVNKSLFYVSKIAKGLYSGMLNSDQEFSLFQEKALNDVIANESYKICSGAIKNADTQLKRIAGQMSEQKGFIVPKRGSTEVESIEVDTSEYVKGLKESEEKRKLIEAEADKIAHIDSDEIKYIKEINKKSEKIGKIKKDIFKRMKTKQGSFKKNADISKKTMLLKNRKKSKKKVKKNG